MLLAGPFTGRLLGDMGAEIIKVEPPGKPDPLREWGKARYKGRSLWWGVQSRNKKCVTLDLRTEKGQELLLELARQSDVVVENFRPGTLERWNLGWDELHEANPAARPLPRLRLRADGALRPPGRIRLGRGGHGRPSLPERVPRRAAAQVAPLARRLAGGHVRGAGDSRRPLPPRRARRRTRTGGRRLAARVLLRAPREHRAGVRPSRHRPRPGRDRAQGRRPLEHLPVAGRQVDGDRRERRQRLPPALRGDGLARARRRRALRHAPRARRPPGGDRGDRRRVGRAGSTPRRSTASSTRRA